MLPGERPDKCRNKDNVEGPIAEIGGMKGLLAPIRIKMDKKFIWPLDKKSIM
jgi:hypothetical protein